jgi:low affinity Fe/Cu permease
LKRAKESTPAPTKKGFSALFHHFAKWTSRTAGSPYAFLLAVLVILGWAVTGPMFGYSDTWQLVINTGTTIVTFLMVFLIQNTQNRDSQAILVKLDELIRAIDNARNAVLDSEDLDEDELEKLRAQYAAMGAAAQRQNTTEATEDKSRTTPPGEGGNHPISRRKTGN